MGYLSSKKIATPLVGRGTRCAASCAGSRAWECPSAPALGMGAWHGREKLGRARAPEDNLIGPLLRPDNAGDG